MIEKMFSVFKPKVEEIESTPAELITAAGSWEELDAVLRSLGRVKGSAEDDPEYASEELVEAIQAVRNGFAALNSITRNYGLRAKVEELLATEKIPEETPSNMITAVQSWEELDDVLNTLGSIQMSDDSGLVYIAPKLIRTIKELRETPYAVREKRALVNTITKDEGLQAKVIELLGGEPAPAEQIASTRSWDELILTIEFLGSVQGPKEDDTKYTAADIIASLQDIRNGKALLTSVTRAQGLRAKATELFEADQSAS